MNLIHTITNSDATLSFRMDRLELSFIINGKPKWLYYEAVYALHKQLNKKKNKRDQSTIGALRKDLKKSSLRKKDVKVFLNECFAIRDLIHD